MRAPSSRGGRRPGPLLSLLVWMLPAGAMKNRLLRALGNHIGAGVRIAPTLVLKCGPFRIGDGGSIGIGNVFRNLAEVRLDAEAFIGGWNQFTAAPVYQLTDPGAGRLELAAGAVIVNRHYFDCSGTIRVGRMAMLAGVRSIFQSHELDLETNRATYGTISVGEYTFTGSRVLVLKDSAIPPRSLLAAGTVWVRSSDAHRPGLYGGNPARWLKPVDDWAWMNRAEVHTNYEGPAALGALERRS